MIYSFCAGLMFVGPIPLLAKKHNFISTRGNMLCIIWLLLNGLKNGKVRKCILYIFTKLKVNFCTNIVRL